MAVTPEFWRRRTVLITGHSGFKGTWLAVWLHRLGARLLGYSLAPPTSPSIFELTGIAGDMTSVHGDVRDADALLATVGRHRPEVIFHLAAQSLVRRSYDDPAGTYGTNVMGTVNLLEAVRRSPGVRVVVNVTSDKCYENSDGDRPFVESDPMGGYDPYSSSKGCAELVTAAYRRSYFAAGGDVALASARAGNVIGAGDWAQDRLIPDLVRSFTAQQTAMVRQPGAQRPWQHVLEPLAGYLALAEGLWEDGCRYAGGWNFGPAPEDIHPVAWVADRVTALWGEGAQWAQASGSHPHEARSLRLECAKAARQLGWRPRLSLDEALEWTVNGYKAHAQGAALRPLMERQIERYQERP